ncbi:hypothetical protein LINPERPRIM_LOCUS1816 [Linum perenne]|jgi:hypothetical protein
MMS